MKRSILSMFVGLSTCATGLALQEPTESATQDSTAAWPSATVNAIMVQAVNNIAIRYNLNAEQKQKTQDLMETEVHRFLKENEDTVWPVIRDLIQTQFRNPENKGDRMRIGKSAAPLAKLAQEAILRANEEWRFFLTEEQKSVHDYDLQEMKKTFQKMDENLRSWADGRATQDGIFPPPNKTGNAPPRPSKPKDKGLPPAQRIAFEPGHIFEAIVEEFIKEYELGKGQITSAWSILEEFKAKANDFKSSKKEELARINAGLMDAHERRDTQAKRRLDAERKKVLAPVVELTEQMSERLRNLLTTAQLQKHSEKAEANDATRKLAKKASRAKSVAKPAPSVADSTAKKPESNDDGE